MINPKLTTQRSVMQQRNVSHSIVGIVAIGNAMPGNDIGVSSLKCTASLLLLLLAFIENCLVNNCLIMIIAIKQTFACQNVFMPTGRRYLKSYPVIDQKWISDIEMIIVQNR